MGHLVLAVSRPIYSGNKLILLVRVEKKIWGFRKKDPFKILACIHIIITIVTSCHVGD